VITVPWNVVACKEAVEGREFKVLESYVKDEKSYDMLL